MLIGYGLRRGRAPRDAQKRSAKDRSRPGPPHASTASNRQSPCRSRRCSGVWSDSRSCNGAAAIRTPVFPPPPPDRRVRGSESHATRRLRKGGCGVRSGRPASPERPENPEKFPPAGGGRRVDAERRASNSWGKDPRAEPRRAGSSSHPDWCGGRARPRGAPPRTCDPWIGEARLESPPPADQPGAASSPTCRSIVRGDRRTCGPLVRERRTSNSSSISS